MKLPFSILPPDFPRLSESTSIDSLQERCPGEFGEPSYEVDFRITSPEQSVLALRLGAGELALRNAYVRELSPE